MKYALLLTLIFAGTHLYASEHNTTGKPSQTTKSKVKKNDNNVTDKKKKLAEKIKKQMELEEKYAKEQRFYQGDEYDLKAHEVDPNSLPDVPVIEPDDDFDITDVYRDDI